MLIKSDIIVPCINNELQLRLICAARKVLNAGLFVDVVSRFCGRVIFQNVSDKTEASTSLKKFIKPFSLISLMSLLMTDSGEPTYLPVNVDSTNHFCTWCFT